MNYFLHSYGPASYQTMILNWVFSGITLAVCALIAVLLLGAIFRRRPAADSRALGPEQEGTHWMMGGSIMATIMLFGMAIYALVALNETATIPGPPAVTLTVTGYDWWWKVEYEDAKAGNFFTANEIHIPTGSPVLIHLKSADVIHAFWVPLLAGKTEMIPGLTNEQWLQADKPGIYHGKCTQFCGLQHAHMDFEVIAETPEDFAHWLSTQRAAVAAPVTPLNQQGQAIFIGRCAACHTVQGLQPTGGHAPDLTHFASRRMIGAGFMTNTPDHLTDWIAHVQELKPGAEMPDFAFSPAELSALSAYLATLK